MRIASISVLVIILFGPIGAARAAHRGFDASSEAIKTVVSGKTCIGADTLHFGTAGPENSGTFERSGQEPAEYHIGEGTIMIWRKGALHGHVTSVSVPRRMLYMGRGRFKC
jgi:hypothetical protein